MDLGRLSPGERIAAASGVALFLSLFLDWLEDLTAWELFVVVDGLFTVLALSALALAGARGAGINLPRWPMVQVGVVALAVTLPALLEGAERGAGIWLCAAAAAGILYGGAAFPRRDARPRRRGRAGRPVAQDRWTPPRDEPPVRSSEPSSTGTGPPPPSEAIPSRPPEAGEQAPRSPAVEDRDARLGPHG